MRAYVKPNEEELKKLRGRLDRSYWKPKLEQGEITTDEFAFLTASDEGMRDLAQQHFCNLIRKASPGLTGTCEVDGLLVVEILKKNLGIDFELIGLNEQQASAAVAAMNKLTYGAQPVEFTDSEEEALGQFSIALAFTWMMSFWARFGLIDTKVESDEDTQVM